jgi:hypothetical protein
MAKLGDDENGCLSLSGGGVEPTREENHPPASGAANAKEVAPGVSTARYLDPATFRDHGYLQESNRLFFHPLGLALELGGDGLLRVEDYRYDLEGMIFDESEDLLGKALSVRQIQQSRRRPRHEALGYWLQPVPLFWDDPHISILPPIEKGSLPFAERVRWATCDANPKPHRYHPNLCEGNIQFVADPRPSAEDLDAVAEEQKAVERTGPLKLDPLAREIVRMIAASAISVAIVRSELRWDGALDQTEKDIIEDAVGVLTGDDTGCFDESELTSENCAGIWVEEQIRKAIEKAYGRELLQVVALRMGKDGAPAECGDFIGASGPCRLRAGHVGDHEGFEPPLAVNAAGPVISLPPIELEAWRWATCDSDPEPHRYHPDLCEGNIQFVAGPRPSHLPSGEDLDAVAEEQKAVERTSGEGPASVQLTPAGPCLYVFGVQIRTWIGYPHVSSLAEEINRRARLTPA